MGENEWNLGMILWGENRWTGLCGEYYRGGTEPIAVKMPPMISKEIYKENTEVCLKDITSGMLCMCLLI